MKLNKLLNVGLLVTTTITIPIIATISCKQIVASSNQKQTFSFNYSKDGINHYNIFVKLVKDSWDNKIAKNFIFKITNKSNKTTIFKLAVKEGKDKREKLFKEIKMFLNK